MLNQTQHKILKEIWFKDSFTRQELSKKLDLNKSTVSRNLEYLIEKEFILNMGEINPGKTGGRKTQLLSYNHNKMYSLGISILEKKIFAVIINMKGEIIEKEEHECLVTSSNIFNYIFFILDKLTVKYKNLFNINIALPGIVDYKTGVVHLSEGLQINEMNFKKVIEDKYGIFTFIENDANAAAAAYLLHTKLKLNNLIYFVFFFPEQVNTITGIGAGIIVDKKLHRGSNLAAGEVKISGLKRKVLIDKNRLYNDVLDDEVKCFLTDMAYRISEVSSLLDPDKIILGGDISIFTEEIKDFFCNEILKNSNQKNGFIQIDSGESETVAIGSVIAFYNEFMNDYIFASKILTI